MKRSIFILVFVCLGIACQAIPLSLNNGDFEKGRKVPFRKNQGDIDNNPAEGWRVIHENDQGGFYVAKVTATRIGSGTTALFMQAFGHNNIIQHPILPSEATADKYRTFKVTMDLGTRMNSAIPMTLKIMIWDLLDQKPLTSQLYTFPLESAGLIERKTFTLNYKNTIPNPKKHPIALRIVTNSKGRTYKTTHWIDNVELEAIPQKKIIRKKTELSPKPLVKNNKINPTIKHGLFPFCIILLILFKRKIVS